MSPDTSAGVITFFLVKWNEPGPNRDAVAGLLLVAYKIAVLAPVIAAFVRLWPPQKEQDERETAQT